ncbi:hypothetical protein C8Q77DRAFT_713037 [Trametes polyzona]|nr:hypothetical protein C8Q77DRAFT_713037 [Trametes polyzona]
MLSPILDGDDDRVGGSDLQAVWGNGHPPSGSSDIPESTSFSSAVKRSETTPAKRRHGSDAAARRARTDHDRSAVEGASHVRARTLDDDAGMSTGSTWRAGRDASHHPLKASSVASSSSVTLEHDTRPTMRRLLSLDNTPNGVHDHDRDHEGERRSDGVDKETLVIVHEVQPTDSLAGVALKYGISLAELRRANQLWASDTIHLRNTLYIPVDKARHVRHLKTALPDSDAQPDHPDATPSGPGPPSGQLKADGYTLRRVPASQLSFFPPPTHPPSPPRTGGLTPRSSQTLPTRRPPSGRPHIPLGFTRAQDAPLQSVLDVFSTSLRSTTNQLRAYAQSQGSLFSAFPVKPSNSLASRLSLESNSATASSASEDLDWEHEMEDIGPLTAAGPGRPRKASATSKSRSAGTLRARRPRSSSPDADADDGGRDSVEMDAAPFVPSTSPTAANGKLRRNSSARSQGSAGRAPRANGHAGPARVVPYAGADVVGEAEWTGAVKSGVRTAQLEPSPGMQLPTLQRRRPKAGESYAR